MIERIVVASSNPNKVREISEICGPVGLEFIAAPEGFNPEESGETFAENAYIKARSAAITTGEYALGDDSGLCVEAMGGAPGLFSARFEKTPEKRISKLLNILDTVPEEKRGAKFVCSMILVDPEGRKLKGFEGAVYGQILREVRGVNGFGYDPIFYLPSYNMTMAEIDSNTKNTISHRAMAMGPILDYVLRHNRYEVTKFKKTQKL